MTTSATSQLVPPPGPGASETLRYGARLLREPDAALVRLYETFGPVARVRVGPLTLVLLVGPDAIRLLMTAGADAVRAGPIWDKVLPFYRGALLSTDGEEHHAQRRLVQAAVRRADVNEQLTGMLAAIRERMARWGPSIDAHLEMRRLTLDIAARVFLGIRLDEPTAVRYLEWQRAMSAMILSPPWLVVPFGTRWRGMRAQQHVWRFLRAVIAERRRNPGNDAMSALIAERDLDDARLVVHAFTLLSAGHETTAAYLTFALAMLAARPDLLARIEHEQHQRLGDDPPTAEALHDLPFTANYLREVERLYPPTPYIARTAMADLNVTGYHIPRGSTLMGSIRLTHLLGEVFPQPTEFRPDRFAESDDGPGRFELVGFGGGPHICLGKSIALIESTLVLHSIVRSFRVCASIETGPPRARFHPFALPAAPIPVRLAPRDGCAW